MNNGSGYRFLGLTKQQFIAVLVTLAVAVLTIQAYLVIQDRNLAEQGAESHAALCANRVSVEGQISDSKKFLALTIAERVKKYGDGVGRIPEATIRIGLERQEEYLKSLDVLHC